MNFLNLYKWPMMAVIAFYVLTTLASFRGWGLSSDAEARAQGKSVRSGSFFARSGSGGPHSGK